jgi:predicted DNA-binding protein with PD1-like motif
MIANGQNSPSSLLEGFAFRARPHEDLKQSILEFAKINAIRAGAIVTAVGSLEQFNIRYANLEHGEMKKGHFEIMSLVGTLSDSACHLHLSVSDKTGKLYGGHLLQGNLIYTTAEIVLVKLSDLEFSRAIDPSYNYKELVVTVKQK